MAQTNTIGSVNIPYSGPEATVTPSNTPNDSVLSKPSALVGLYNTDSVATPLGGSAAPVWVTTDTALVPSKPAQASLVANTALSIAVPAGVKAVTVWNGMSNMIFREWTGAATAGSLGVAPNVGSVTDKGALGGLTLSLFSAVAATVNGTTAGNVVVEFWS